MAQEDAFSPIDTEPQLHMNAASFFSVTETVNFKPMTTGPVRETGHLPPIVTRLASLVSLGAVLLGPLSGCGSTGASTIPCPVPTSTPTGTPVPAKTPTISCTTSGGTHYLWLPTSGGWVRSDDGQHPNSGARGVGGDDAHGGVGDGHGGAGHGGGDGG